MGGSEVVKVEANYFCGFIDHRSLPIMMHCQFGYCPFAQLCLESDNVTLVRDCGWILHSVTGGHGKCGSWKMSWLNCCTVKSNKVNLT